MMNEALISVLKERLAAMEGVRRPLTRERRQVRDVIRKIVSGKIAAPRADTLRKVAAELDLDPSALLSLIGQAPGLSTPEFVPAPVEAGGFSRLPRDVPVMGTAAGSLAGSFHFEGGVIDYVRRPPGLTGAKDIYGIFITGSSMEPEHRPGDLRFVNPHRPPAIGDTVIVQVRAHETAPIEAYIKHLVRRTGEWLILHQLNEPAEVKIKAANVVAVHKVLSVNELFGV